MSGAASAYESEWSSYQLAYGHSIDKDNELSVYGHAEGGSGRVNGASYSGSGLYTDFTGSGESYVQKMLSYLS